MERKTIKPWNPNGRPKDLDANGERNAITVSEIVIEVMREHEQFDNITKKQIRSLMRLVADRMADTLMPGKKIRWTGFGTFYVGKAKERIVEGMWGDTPLYVPRYYVGRFKAYRRAAVRLKAIPVEQK